MTTEFQVLANQQNAKLSTGPKETSKTKINAQKYGVFSKDIIIRCKYYQESITEFQKLYNDFIKEYEPKTITERILVEEALDSYWRLKRIRVARKSEIIKKIMKSPEKTRKDIHFEEMLSQLQHHNPDEAINSMTREMIQLILEKREEELARLTNGNLSEAEVDSLLRDFSENELPNNIFNLSNEEKKEVLEERLSSYCAFYEAWDEIKAKQEAELIKLNQEIELCDCTLENLSTYETTLERKFYRAIISLRQIKKGII